MDSFGLVVRSVGVKSLSFNALLVVVALGSCEPQQPFKGPMELYSEDSRNMSSRLQP